MKDVAQNLAHLEGLQVIQSRFHRWSFVVLHFSASFVGLLDLWCLWYTSFKLLGQGPFWDIIVMGTPFLVICSMLQWDQKHPSLQSCAKGSVCFSLALMLYFLFYFVTRISIIIINASKMAQIASEKSKSAVLLNRWVLRLSRDTLRFQVVLIMLFIVSEVFPVVYSYTSLSTFHREQEHAFYTMYYSLEDYTDCDMQGKHRGRVQWTWTWSCTGCCGELEDHHSRQVKKVPLILLIPLSRIYSLFMNLSDCWKKHAYPVWGWDRCLLDMNNVSRNVPQSTMIRMMMMINVNWTRHQALTFEFELDCCRNVSHLVFEIALWHFVRIQNLRGGFVEIILAMI